MHGFSCNIGAQKMYGMSKRQRETAPAALAILLVEAAEAVKEEPHERA
jgi:hypothetical protein